MRRALQTRSRRVEGPNGEDGEHSERGEVFPAGTYWLQKFAGVSVETLEGAAAAATMPT